LNSRNVDFAFLVNKVNSRSVKFAIEGFDNKKYTTKLLDFPFSLV